MELTVIRSPFIHRVRMNNFIHQPFGPIMYIRRMKHDFFFFKIILPSVRRTGERGERQV